jgi:hypothetical protein
VVFFTLLAGYGVMTYLERFFASSREIFWLWLCQIRFLILNTGDPFGILEHSRRAKPGKPLEKILLRTLER